MLSYGEYRFVKADTDELKERTYRLRYRIYVEEFGFEKPENHPGGLEMDGCESHAVHFAALNLGGEVVGTIRLILHSEQGFPIERAVKIFFPGEKPLPERAAEISRLAVSGMYRRRRLEGKTEIGYYVKKSGTGFIPRHHSVFEGNNLRNVTVVIMGLYLVMLQESKRLGLNYWYMITDQKAYKIFKRFGFLFRPIGEPVMYHGLRIPYLGVISDIEHSVIEKNPFLMKRMLQSLPKEHCPPVKCPLLCAGASRPEPRYR